MNSLYEKIYDCSPIFLQNKMISFYGRKIFSQRYGEVYYKWLSHFKNKDYSDLEKEKSYQLSELKNLLIYSKNNSLFYKNIYKDISLDDFSYLEDIKYLPVIDKETLRENIKDFYTITPIQGIESFTGGTTGKSLRVYFSKEDFQKRMAYLDAFKHRCGIDDLFNARKATFSGRSFAKGIFQKRSQVYWRFNRAYNQRLYSTFDMQPENIPYYIDDLNKFSPQILNGFVSAIYQIAKYIIDNNIPINFTPKAIFTTSETLLPLHRSIIEKAFKSKIFNQYASAEGAPFITECIAGKLHYNIDTGVIEQTEDGSILITSFTSYGTPLIRYNIGDQITFSQNHGLLNTGICACGSCHPIVESIDGRSVDYLYSPNRGKVSLSHLADVIKGIPNSIKEMQFIQDSLDEIKIKINVDSRKYTKNDEKKIIESMKYRFGENMKFEIQITDYIEKSVGGKFSIIKNNLKNIL